MIDINIRLATPIPSEINNLDKTDFPNFDQNNQINHDESDHLFFTVLKPLNYSNHANIYCQENITPIKYFTDKQQKITIQETLS